MATLERIRKELKDYDGRSVSMLSELAAQHKSDPSFLNCLIALTADDEENISDGATYILKLHIDDGGALSAQQTKALVKNCGKITSWAAQLHICQVIARLKLSQSQTAALALWLEPLLSHQRPFLRAWSLDSLCALTQTNSAFKQQALDALTAAENDKAASVRARARNISRSSFGADT